ncbi:MAG TPA: type II toxin-antitoxin system VapC family toxin [Holophaga sp.]|nr:type II toxin-antitoxin system VapC family toxin [Holophaga sp.]
MARTVLDASAMLALLQGERGWERVVEAMETGDCWISSANLSEVMTRLIFAGLAPDAAQATVEALPVQTAPCGHGTAVAAARLTLAGKPLGLSLGDRLCLATAQDSGNATVVLTADRAWKAMALPGITIELIREPAPPAS